MRLEAEGKTLKIRRIRPDDAPYLYEAYREQDFIRLYRSNQASLTLDELKKALKKECNRSPLQSKYLEFIAEHKKKGPIGITVLADYSPLHKRVEYLIGIFKKGVRGHGYGVEMTLLVLDLVFNAYKLNKIYVYVYEYNPSSHEAIIKLGFKEEGFLKHHHYSIKEKRFVSLYLDALCEEDFRQSEQIRRLSIRFLGRDITKRPISITTKPVPSQEISVNDIEKQLFGNIKVGRLSP